MYRKYAPTTVNFGISGDSPNSSHQMASAAHRPDLGFGAEAGYFDYIISKPRLRLSNRRYHSLTRTLELRPSEFILPAVIMSSRERQSALLDSTDPASPISVPARQTALILADYQNFVVNNAGPGSANAVTTARSLREWAEAHAIPVILASVATTELPPSQSKFHKRGASIVDLFKANPELGQIHPTLAGSEDLQGIYHVLRRLGLVSVLHSGGLREILRENQTRSLIIAGLSTSGCVLSTVRGANDEGYIVTVVEDACADPVPDLHDVLVRNVLPMTASVVSFGQLKEAWSENGDV